ncbi:hypothetical protein ACE1CD_10365 [Aerosakkonema sp. BLCC-F183]|uniref:hypothetical protein n=1 Tax=Aerosakkonema sp. BLCC-F183 TaxID=3342834 RepID=UPI0035B7150B
MTKTTKYVFCRGEAFGRQSIAISNNFYLRMLRPADDGDNRSPSATIFMSECFALPTTVTIDRPSATIFISQYFALPRSLNATCLLLLTR